MDGSFQLEAAETQTRLLQDHGAHDLMARG
jgi:hypothetical protein